MNEAETASSLPSKLDVFGVGISATTYQEAVEVIMSAARSRRSFGVSALAVHGLMEAEADDALREKVNRLDLVTPDGQPVRWLLNARYGAGLPDRVYGPTLTWHVLAAAEKDAVGVFLFGSTPEVLEAFSAEIRRRHPNLTIAGMQADRFRDATPEEDQADIDRINGSGAGLVLVGRGCPRQEEWVADHLGNVDGAMLAVGAAFDYGAGNKKEPPLALQRLGLQWAWRLAEEPGRLWRRYLTTNSRFLWLAGRDLIRSRTNG